MSSCIRSVRERTTEQAKALYLDTHPRHDALTRLRTLPEIPVICWSPLQFERCSQFFPVSPFIPCLRVRANRGKLRPLTLRQAPRWRKRCSSGC
jgi:hypothetical protein